MYMQMAVWYTLSQRLCLTVHRSITACDVCTLEIKQLLQHSTLRSCVRILVQVWQSLPARQAQALLHRLIMSLHQMSCSCRQQCLSMRSQRMAPCREPHVQILKVHAAQMSAGSPVPIANSTSEKLRRLQLLAAVSHSQVPGERTYIMQFGQSQSCLSACSPLLASLGSGACHRGLAVADPVHSPVLVIGHQEGTVRHLQHVHWASCTPCACQLQCLVWQLAGPFK